VAVVRRRAQWAIGFVLVLGLIFGGIALAATVHPTSFKFGASNTSVQKGKKVSFSGNLKSGFKKCKSWRPVTLYRNGQALATKQTSKTGHFNFTRKINHTKNWQVRFGGRTGGVHPHQYACTVSHSKVIKVKVKK
jgi:hypothetical protein